MTAVIALLLIFAVLVGLSWHQASLEQTQKKERLKKLYGHLSQTRHMASFYKHAGACARSKYAEQPNTFYVDEQTWSDLGLDRVFDAIDIDLSPAGKESVYTSLRLPLEAMAERESLDRMAEGFQKTPEEREKAFVLFDGLKESSRQKIKGLEPLSLFEYLALLQEIRTGYRLWSILALTCFAASLLFFFIRPTWGIVLFMAVIAVNISTYFHIRGKLGAYFKSLQRAVALAGFASRYAKADLKATEPINERIGQLGKELAPIRKNAWMMEAGDGRNSLPDVLLGYLRMMTHIDLLYFNASVKRVQLKRKELFELYHLAGLAEKSLAIASLRTALPVWCRPQFTGKRQLILTEVYHPLIKDCVPNSAALEQNLLLTGSNASGKSTFLRTALIAVLLGEALDTVPARFALYSAFAVMSCMSASDDLASGASLYMAEINGLKRIIDAAQPLHSGGTPILAAADEILRGTNTAERVAGSTEILRWLGKQNALVLAATHDSELTESLAGKRSQDFAMKHFSESTDKNGVVFTYLLQDGPADSSNAISLLIRTGFPKEITERAAQLVEHTS